MTSFGSAVSAQRFRLKQFRLSSLGSVVSAQHKRKYWAGGEDDIVIRDAWPVLTPPQC